MICASHQGAKKAPHGRGSGLPILRCMLGRSGVGAVTRGAARIASHLREVVAARQVANAPCGKWRSGGYQAGIVWVVCEAV